MSRAQYDQMEIQQRPRRGGYEQGGMGMRAPKQGGHFGGGMGGGEFGGGGGQGFGGGSVTRGAPAPPQMAPPPKRDYQVQGFNGLDAGGSQQIGDLRIDNGDMTGMYNSYNNLYGDIATSQIGADASMYNTSTQAGANMYDSLLRMLGIEDTNRTNLAGIDSNERIQGGSQGVQRHGIDTQAETSRLGFDNQYNIADLTSGRDLEGINSQVQGRTDVATIGADSARDVANIRDLDSQRGHDEFNSSLSRYDDYMASRGGGGLESMSIPSGGGMERLDSQGAINQAMAQNAMTRAAQVNNAGGGGSSPQSGAATQRADLQEAMANQSARTNIIPAYAQANNENRLGLLAAQAEARRAQTADRDGLLNFLRTA